VLILLMDLGCVRLLRALQDMVEKAVLLVFLDITGWMQSVINVLEMQQRL
jgi:hypothetical protein